MELTELFYILLSDKYASLITSDSRQPTVQWQCYQIQLKVFPPIMYTVTNLYVYVIINSC